MKRKHKIKSSSGCQENLQHCLGVHEKVTQTPGGVKDFWKVIKEFFSSIPHQKSALGDKPAIHHEDGAKDTNHLLVGEFLTVFLHCIYGSSSKKSVLRVEPVGKKINSSAHTG